MILEEYGKLGGWRFPLRDQNWNWYAPSPGAIQRPEPADDNAVLPNGGADIDGQPAAVPDAEANSAGVPVDILSDH